MFKFIQLPFFMLRECFSVPIFHLSTSSYTFITLFLISFLNSY